jgi:ABC-type branched-subunit amino acid transport system substrate-binding protein
MKTLKVGITALFDPQVTRHARTFMRALAVARSHLPGLTKVEFIFRDDGASQETALTVAHYFLQQEVDVVVGHFSSDAALSAAKYYRLAGIPLLTPAATMDSLCEPVHGAFRLCPPDKQLAMKLIDFVISRSWVKLDVGADDSAHGIALARAISEEASRRGLAVIAPGGKADAEVFAGRLGKSRERMLACAQSALNRPLILTDDAASPGLGEKPDNSHDVYIVGIPAIATPLSELFSEYCHQHYGDEPETYYMECIAALQIISQLAEGRKSNYLAMLGEKGFETVLGEIFFTQGESRHSAHTVWELTPTGFNVIT